MTTIDKIEKILEKIPNPVRWGIAIPAAVFVSTIVQPLYLIISYFLWFPISGIFGFFGFNPYDAYKIFGTCVMSFLAVYTLVWTMALVVPKYKIITAIICSFVFIFFTGILLPAMALTLDDRPIFILIAQNLIGFIALVLVFAWIYQRYSKKQAGE